jgi:HSP20 family protein
MVRMHRGPLTQLFGEVNRIQDEFTRLFGQSTPFAGAAINVWADENAFHAETDLPGIDPATLEITVTDGTQLVIRGERKSDEPEGAVWLRQERPSGSFSREVTLPSLVDADKVEARYEAGVLKLTLPKSEAAKPRKIVVKS